MHEGRGQIFNCYEGYIVHTHRHGHLNVDSSSSLSFSDYLSLSPSAPHPFLSLSLSTAFSHLLTHLLLLMKCCIIRIADCRTVSGPIGPPCITRNTNTDTRIHMHTHTHAHAYTRTPTHTVFLDLPAIQPPILP